MATMVPNRILESALPAKEWRTDLEVRWLNRKYELEQEAQRRQCDGRSDEAAE